MRHLPVQIFASLLLTSRPCKQKKEILGESYCIGKIKWCTMKLEPNNMKQKLSAFFSLKENISWLPVLETLPTQKKRPISQWGWTEPKSGFDQPTILHKWQRNILDQLKRQETSCKEEKWKTCLHGDIRNTKTAREREQYLHQVLSDKPTVYCNKNDYTEVQETCMALHYNIAIVSNKKQIQL